MTRERTEADYAAEAAWLRVHSLRMAETIKRCGSDALDEQEVARFCSWRIDASTGVAYVAAERAGHVGIGMMDSASGDAAARAVTEACGNLRARVFRIGRRST